MNHDNTYNIEDMEEKIKEEKSTPLDKELGKVLQVNLDAIPKDTNIDNFMRSMEQPLQFISPTPKPICVIYFDQVTGLDRNRVQEYFDEKWNDYHVLVVPSHDMEEVMELEVFYDKDFKETDYETLKALIMDELKKLKDDKAEARY
jgi:hypothetical protein